MNAAFIGELPREARILEVGCNTGMQLVGLQAMGFTNLYGIELQAYAVEKARLEARLKGYSVTELALADGSIRLVVAVGGDA